VQARQLQPGQGLQGFAQAHLVGQDAAEVVLLQEAQPVDAVALVGPQQTIQGGRQLEGGHGEIAILLTRGLDAPVGAAASTSTPSRASSEDFT
jgi:hypothetical protein